MNAGEAQPSYGTVLVAVLVAGLVSGVASTLFIGVAALGGLAVYSLLGALIRAFAVQVILKAMGWEVSYVAAVIAMLAGAIVSIVVRIAAPQALMAPVVPFFSLSGLPSLLLSAWLIQMSAGRERRELPL
jgi:hypothetical protein